MCMDVVVVVAVGFVCVDVAVRVTFVFTSFMLNVTVIVVYGDFVNVFKVVFVVVMREVGNNIVKIIDVRYQVEHIQIYTRNILR